MLQDPDRWPPLPYAAWKDTFATVHLWTQVVGKVRLALTPWLNHSWHVTLRVSARGLATPLIPHGAVGLTLAFDLLAGALVIQTTEGGERRVPLAPGSVAGFYAQVMEGL